MATKAQIKANRQNALKSTGPRTNEGKETVSQNATKHGLCSCKNVIKGERLDEYKQFHNEMIEDLSPAGAMEEMLAERIINLSWRLKRAELFQNAVIESMSDEIFHESWDDCERAKDQAEDGDMSLLLGKSIRRDFSGYKILEQLLVYERRIESSLYKATAEFRKIQKLRRKENEGPAWAEAHLRKEPEGPTNFAKQSQSMQEYRTGSDERMRSEGKQDVNDEVETKDELKNPSSSYELRRDKQSQSSVILAKEDKLNTND